MVWFGVGEGTGLGSCFMWESVLEIVWGNKG